MELAGNSLSPRESSNQFSQIALDSFHVNSDWYHYSLLELIQIQSHRTDTQLMAKALGLKHREVKHAIERLERLGMIRKNEKGEFQSTEEHRTCLGAVETSIAHRKMQKQFLEKATTALEEVHESQFSQTAMTMAINTKHIPEAKTLIAKFRRDLSQLLETGEKDEVYNLMISLYPLSQVRMKGAGDVPN